MVDGEHDKPVNVENAALPEMPERSERSRGERFTLDLNKINAEIEAMLGEEPVDQELLKEAWAIRAAIAEKFVESLEESMSENPKQRERVQFDIIIDKALIFEKFGYTLRYLMELDTAEGFARRHHLDGVGSLTEEIDDRVGELDNSPDALVVKLRRHLSFGNREFLRLMIREGIEPDELISRIRAMIIDEEGNPYEVFAELGLTI